MIIYGNCCHFIRHWHKRLSFWDSVTLAWHASRITLPPKGCELHPRGWHFLWLTFLCLISEQPHSDPENTDSISTRCYGLCSDSSFLPLSQLTLYRCALIWPSGYFLKHCNLLCTCCNQVNLFLRHKASISTISIIFIVPILCIYTT